MTVIGKLDDLRDLRAVSADVKLTRVAEVKPTHQGSVIAVSDASGAVLGVNRCDPYGVPAASKLGRFLQTDPIGYDDDLNLYAYVGNDPLDRTDPDGLYGRGVGFTDDEWKRFDKVQQSAARDFDKRAAKLEEKADKLDKKGKEGGGDLRARAAALRGGADALRSDGSDGKMANMVDSAAYVAAGGSELGAAGVMPGEPNKMLVNRGNAAGFLSGIGMAKWIVGHESLHTAGVAGHAIGSNGKPSYKWGTDPQREAFKSVTGTPGAIMDPDHIVEQVYPGFRPDR